jgi:gluconolactonase
VNQLTADQWTQLPDHLHHKGAPSPWAKMTRPGQQMHSFLEAAFFDEAGNLWLSDVPYGRVFSVSPSGDWTQMHQIDGEPHAMRIAPDGKHIAVDYRHGLIKLTGENSFDVISNGGATPFLGLSDMAYGPDGALWFTDSGRSSLSDPIGRVYRWKDGDLRMVADCVPYSNGDTRQPSLEILNPLACDRYADDRHLLAIVWRAWSRWVGLQCPRLACRRPSTSGPCLCL